MAQQPLFVLDSFLELNTSTEEELTNNTNSCFFSNFPDTFLQEIPVLKQSSHSPSNSQPILERERKINVDIEVERMNYYKHEKQGNQSDTLVENAKEKRVKLDTKKNNKKKDPDHEKYPTGFVYVRAKRGEATDKHSLAERVRREKISLRMKLLQSLVPGCDKITRKALILDQILKYVQSMQNRVKLLEELVGCADPTMFSNYEMDLSTNVLAPEMPLPTNAASTSTSMSLYDQYQISQDNGYLLQDTIEHNEHYMCF